MTLILVAWLGMNNNVEDIFNSGRRDKTEIIAAITAMTQKPSKITQIMDQVSLSYKVLKKYMKFMIRLHLVESRKVAGKGNKTERYFHATEKGLTFLKTYCDLLRIIYGKDFLQNHNNLAVACIKYCNEAQ
jgi:predicted transcriptional regulator